jgi:hypothetical protein
MQASWPSHKRPYRNVYRKSYAIRLRESALAFLGNKCNSPECRWLNEDGSLGCKDLRSLQIDHVYDDGAEERRKHGTNVLKIYKRVLEDKEGRYQALCANCNWIKRRLKENAG